MAFDVWLCGNPSAQAGVDCSSLLCKPLHLALVRPVCNTGCHTYATLHKLLHYLHGMGVSSAYLVVGI